MEKEKKSVYNCIPKWPTNPDLTWPVLELLTKHKLDSNEIRQILQSRYSFSIVLLDVLSRAKPKPILKKNQLKLQKNFQYLEGYISKQYQKAIECLNPILKEEKYKQKWEEIKKDIDLLNKQRLKHAKLTQKDMDGLNIPYKSATEMVNSQAYHLYKYIEKADSINKLDSIKKPLTNRKIFKIIGYLLNDFYETKEFDDSMVKNCVENAMRLA